MNNFISRHQRRKFFLNVIILVSLFVAPFAHSAAHAQKQTKQFVTAARPRLVLLIAIDQFRYDYLERFGDLYGADGFNRLLKNGASWIDANYDHMPTETAPGHATMLTGAYPAETGIIANEWFDRATEKTVTSVSDDETTLLDSRSRTKDRNRDRKKGSSPRRLMASTLGDEIRLASNNRAKVIGISIKDRAAILPAGRHASAAYWFNTKTGAMVTSDYYFPNFDVPDWVSDFNTARFADSFFGKSWERLLPAAEYLKRAGEDAPAWEVVANGKNTFPHPLTGGTAEKPNSDYYDALYNSPFANEVLLKFAEAAITNEKLGQRTDADVTDVLTVSFSSNDKIGHTYGAYSQEAMDVSLRTDGSVAELLNFIDKNVGLQNTVVALTADHGVAPIPEHAAALGLIAPGSGRIKSADVLQSARRVLSARFGGDEKTKNYIADFNGIGDAGIFLNHAQLARDGVNRDEAARAICEAAMSVTGISRCFTYAQLAGGGVAVASDPIARRALHGFYARRSADVILVQEPFKYIVGSDYSTGATHGTPYNYDTHVPLIIMGRGLRAGRYAQAATPCDIAPTLAALLRVQPPSNSVGRVLSEAFDGMK